MQAYTSTFVIPMRLVKFLTMKQQACRYLKTDERDRKVITKQIDGLKSVDVNLKVPSCRLSCMKRQIGRASCRERV